MVLLGLEIGISLLKLMIIFRFLLSAYIIPFISHNEDLQSFWVSKLKLGKLSNLSKSCSWQIWDTNAKACDLRSYTKPLKKEVNADWWCVLQDVFWLPWFSKYFYLYHLNFILNSYQPSEVDNKVSIFSSMLSVKYPED